MANLKAKKYKLSVCLLVIPAVGLIATSWKYLAVLILLSLGAGPYENSFFYSPCSRYARNKDVGIITVNLLEECNLPDKAMELVSAKAQRRIENHSDESALALSFYLSRIDRTGTLPSQRWLQVTSVYQNFLNHELDKLESATIITADERDRFSWGYKRLGLNIIEGLENHKLYSQCPYYFHRILAINQKLNSKVDTITLLKLCEFYSRHPELKEGRDKTRQLVNRVQENGEGNHSCKERVYRKPNTAGNGYIYRLMCPCNQTSQPDPRSGVICRCMCYQAQNGGVYYCTCDHTGYVLLSEKDSL